MSKKQRRIFWPSLLVILAVTGVLVLVVARTRARSVGKEPAKSVATETRGFTQRPATPPGQRPAPRNLSLQPEAFKLSRTLGQRFMSLRRDVSVIIGTLITDTGRQPVHIVRRQNDRGERVEIALGGGAAPFSWSEEDGSKSSDRAAGESERTLIERLAFDSVDQFVLAQLRGASYYTVARNVMPAEVGGADNYTGPIWDIIRVDDPATDPQKRALSPWRLYYLNSKTGLIDKVVSEVRGERVEANFAGWTDEAGEKFPSRITWTRQGQMIMEFRLTNFALNSSH